MTVQMLQTLSMVAFILAGVLLLVAILLFFLLDVPKLYGDISGKTAKKAIDALRQQNEASGNKVYKSSAVNEQRGKLTDKITQTGKVKKQNSDMPMSIGTEKLDTDTSGNETTVLTNNSEGTTVLPQANETTVLVNEAASSAETTVLVNENPVAQPEEKGKLEETAAISFTGTSEIIE